MWRGEVTLHKTARRGKGADGIDGRVTGLVRKPGRTAIAVMVS